MHADQFLAVPRGGDMCGATYAGVSPKPSSRSPMMTRAGRLCTGHLVQTGPVRGIGDPAVLEQQQARLAVMCPSAEGSP